MEEFNKKVAELRVRFNYTMCQIHVLPGVEYLLGLRPENATPNKVGAKLQADCGCHICGQRAMQKSDGDDELASLKLTRIILDEKKETALIEAAKKTIEKLETEHHPDMLTASICSDVSEGYLLCDKCIAANSLALQTCCDCRHTHGVRDVQGVRGDCDNPPIATGIVRGKEITICERCSLNRTDEFPEARVEQCGNCVHCKGARNFSGVEFITLVTYPVSRNICIDCVMTKTTDELEKTLENVVKELGSKFADETIALNGTAWRNGLSAGNAIVEAFQVSEKTDGTLDKAIQIAGSWLEDIGLLADDIAKTRSDYEACERLLFCKRKRGDDENCDAGENSKRHKDE